MSQTLLDHVANKPATTRVDTAWIKQHCKPDFSVEYWGKILAAVEKSDTRAGKEMNLQVGANTPRQGSMRALLAGGTTQIVKLWKSGGQSAATTGIDDAKRSFVDLLYMLEGPQPSWQLIQPFVTQWAGRDNAYPYFAAKFTSDHIVKSANHAVTLCNQRKNWFTAQGDNLPDHLHFILNDGALREFHQQVSDKQLRYRAAISELQNRQIVNRGHVINKIWMVSPQPLTVFDFTLAGASYTAPAGSQPRHVIYQLQPYEKDYYVYHLSGVSLTRGHEAIWPWVRKELEVQVSKGKKETVTLYLEYVRP